MSSKHKSNGSGKNSVKSTSLRRASTARRLARAGVAVMLVGLLAAAGFVYYANRTTHKAMAIGEGPPPVPRAGGARPWEVELPVSTYTSWHTLWGSAITRIPLVNISGAGPDLVMTLYHNSASVDAPYDITGGSGINLGEGWTLSYGSQLVLDDPNTPTTVTVVADDGTEDVFAWTGSSWQAPNGVHDELIAGPDPYIGPTWQVTHKDQSVDTYASFGTAVAHPLSFADALGHEADFSNWHTASIGGTPQFGTVHAGGGRKLNFVYLEETDRLVEIRDPRDEDPFDRVDIQDRSWTFEYDVNDRLSRIVDPMGYRIDITYDTHGRIATLTDKHSGASGDLYTYTYYDDHRLESVQDPDPVDPQAPRLFQYFDTVGINGKSVYANYTDRRGNEWEYRYNSFGVPGPSPGDPLLRILNPFLEERQFGFDADFNMTDIWDELNNHWTFSYDVDGNVLTSTDPLLHTKTWTYDSLNNVTSYADALSNTVTFDYDATFPTLLAQVTEPGTPAAITTLTYYLTVSKSGLLDTVTDPNGVKTKFDYGLWGQPSNYAEGEVPGSPGTYVVDCSYHFDSGGRQISGSCSPGADASYDDNDNQTGVSVCIPSSGSASTSGFPPEFPPLPGSLASLPITSAFFSGAEYSPKGALERLPLLVSQDNTTWSRELTFERNELGLLTKRRVDTFEMGGGLQSREFNYAYDLANGSRTRTGPDGVETLDQYDAANRLTLRRRGTPANMIMHATYGYYDHGLVQTVSFGNGATVHYTYDAARRVTTIDHRDLPGNTFLELVYTYTTNDLVAGITEYDSGGLFAITDFFYDQRGRLTHEVRDQSPAYNYFYEYDAGGNRTKMVDKTDPLQTVEDRYEYDVDDPIKYGTENNRLMKIERWQLGGLGGNSASFGGTTLSSADSTLSTGDSTLSSADPALPSGDPTLSGGGPMAAAGGPGGGSGDTKFWTKYYYYSSDGDVFEDEGTIEGIVTNFEGSNVYTAYRLGYGANGRTVTHVLGERWGGGEPYEITFAREFRYNSARQRYLNRELDPNDLDNVLSETWSDYDGEKIYGDFEMVTGTQSELRSYEPGIGQVDPWLGGGTSFTTYYHTNALGSTMGHSDSNGDGSFDFVYTAFGERKMGASQRYGYAGVWGYQSHDEFPFMHLGARYYNPATGRFLQRDPIGINGGANVYVYVRNNPITAVDPDGLQVGPPASCPDCDLQPPRLPNPPTLIDKIKDKISDNVSGIVSFCISLKDAIGNLIKIIKIPKPVMKSPVFPLIPKDLLEGIVPPKPGDPPIKAGSG